MELPEYVLLHFQISEHGKWTSPQRPLGPDHAEAINCGLQSKQMAVADARLGELEGCIQIDDLVASLPATLLQPIEIGEDVLALNGLFGNFPNKPDNLNAYVEYGQQVDNSDKNQQQAAQRGVEQAPSRSRTQRSVPQQSEVEQQTANPFDENRINPMLRGSNEFSKRNRATQNYAFNQRLQWQANAALLAPETTLAREGATQSMWMDDKLLVARRVVTGDQNIVQGCWLDWDKLRETLTREVEDLLPDATLAATLPDSEVKHGRRLATLPVHLVIDEPTLDDVVLAPDQQASSAITVSLIVAWSCLLLTTCAVAVLLQGVVKLSERRGAFVSAVTHELRTPLTTFRMYAEMLAQNMVPDADKRAQYLETLRVEADRLSHLVENVLQYARLERGRPGKNRAQVRVSFLIDRVANRLHDRAKQANMTLHVDAEDASDISISTDATAVEQILFNLVDNACKYAVGTEHNTIELSCHVDSKCIQFSVRDHGPGISSKEAVRMFQPFSKSADQAANSAPGVGLGLALCKRLAHDLGGRLTLVTPQGGGAEFVLRLPRS